MTQLSDSRVSLLIELEDRPGALHDLLGRFWQHQLDLTHIESRPVQDGSFDFYVDCIGSLDDPAIVNLLAELKPRVRKLMILDDRSVPWFPRRIAELDLIANRTLDAGTDLQSDHPGFSDAAYRERRAHIDSLARHHKHGEPIPVVDYTDDEQATWRVVYQELRAQHQNFACREYLAIVEELEQLGLYSADAIPQAADLTRFLSPRTGFHMRPVAGLLSSRDFLNGLAFRVFFSTQYIRHHSMPRYTPEPDVCHELIGHAPMFADPSFADFSQEIGLASLGASDLEIEHLARCYWHSVEFGLIESNGERKAYGAGLLSSFGELEYACAPWRPAGGRDTHPEVLPWNPEVAAEQDFPITDYQPVYFAAASLHDAKEQMRAYCRNLPRMFYARYIEATESIWVDRAVRSDVRA